MAYLLEVAEGPGRRGIRPRSLKVATISALMTEAAKGQANLPKLAIQGNYRAVAAQDMAKVYSRNIAHQLFVPDLEQFAFRRAAISDSITEDPSVYLENRQESGMSSFETEPMVLNPAGCAIIVLAKRENADVLGKDKMALR